MMQKTKNGKFVQIKATQRSSVALRDKPDNLLVLLLKQDGSFEEVYNGPAKTPWEKAGKMQKNGERPITLTRLRKILETVPTSFRIPLARSKQKI